MRNITIPADSATVLYTPENIQEIMQISRSSVYKLFKSENFPSIRIGGMLRVEKTAFEAWLKAPERANIPAASTNTADTINK